MPIKIKDKILFFSTVTLVIIHFIGIVGIKTSYEDVFLHLTPFNLLLSCVLLLLNHKEFNKSFLFFSFFIFTIGFLIEVAGVKSGLIFGNYYYGSALGLKILNVPLIIGLNWLLLVYCVGCICNNWSSNIYAKSIYGASMLVILDLFIELVAVKYDLWEWINDSVPIQNYIAWFCISFLLLILFNKFNFNKNNKLTLAVYLVQLVFFVLLSIL